ncbi:MAG: PulJ/GspJ family protein [Minisyncoccota bacterium]
MKKSAVYQKGYSIAEVVIYASILAILLIVIVNMLISISHSRGRLTSSQSLNTSALTTFDRITREIRSAENVDTTLSTLDSSPGRLVLEGEYEDGNARIVEFYINNGILHISENGVDMGPLNQSNTTITNLVFERSATSSVQAIRTQMTIESGSGETYKSENFYTTTLLRQSL